MAVSVGKKQRSGFSQEDDNIIAYTGTPTSEDTRMKLFVFTKLAVPVPSSCTCAIMIIQVRVDDSTVLPLPASEAP